MNKDSQILTKIFNIADKAGLYCSITKENGEVLHIYFGKQTFFTSDCVHNYIYNADGHTYTYKDLKNYVYKCKELVK